MKTAIYFHFFLISIFCHSQKENYRVTNLNMNDEKPHFGLVINQDETVLFVSLLLNKKGKIAKVKGIQLHREFDLVKVDKGESINIFLSFEELDRIEAIEFRDQALDTARDWLLISCYTGQRVSDFMRFTKDMIRIEDENTFIELTQQKTKKHQCL